MSGAARFLNPDEAAALVPDGTVVAVVGAGGGLLEPDEVLAAIERRFLASGHPRELTLVHTQGLGDRGQRGINHFAHEGLVRRVIGSHWSWAPRMQALAAAEKIEAYALPGGVLQHLLRDSAAGRPGLLTHVGLGTFVDPRLEGARMNATAVQPLNEIVRFDGRDYIRYLPLKANVAIVRGSRADARGHVSFEEEGAELDALVLAMAAHNNGGQVIVQVRAEAGVGERAARAIRLPGALVNAVVVVPQQTQSYAEGFDATLSGSQPPLRAEPPEPPASTGSWERRAVGWRAFQELREDDVVSFGFGVPDEVATLAGRHHLRCHATLDHGHHGGHSLQGALFGYVRDGLAMIDSPSQFDFYSGGGIDIAFLGFGEFDGQGNVNVSRLGGSIIGPGGFIDISQGSRRVVFCGTFDARGGQQRKLVPRVEQVSFSGQRALDTRQQVLYVTERAVFRLTPEGIVLEELAPGLDLQADVLGRMGFAPLIGRGGPWPMPLPPAG